MISQRAQTAFKRGQEWEARRNASKAINAYREAIAIEPDWLEPRRRLGAIYLDQGRYDEAAAVYRQAKPLTPPGDGSIDHLLHTIDMIQKGALTPAAYRYYAMAAELPDERLDDKMTLCQKALGLNPTFAAPYALLGQTLLAKGQLNQARVVLERGLACHPTPLVQAMLLFQLGNVSLAIGQRGQALSLFRQVVKLDANPPFTRFANLQLKAAAAGRI